MGSENKKEDSQKSLPSMSINGMWKVMKNKKKGEKYWKIIN